VAEISERDPALEPFETLIGTWDTEAKHVLVDGRVRHRHVRVARRRPLSPPTVPRRRLAFPWRDRVIGAAESGDGLVMEYFDSRGVRRTYAVSIEGRV
jgi:hypothetical protein